MGAPRIVPNTYSIVRSAEGFSVTLGRDDNTGCRVVETKNLKTSAEVSSYLASNCFCVSAASIEAIKVPAPAVAAKPSAPKTDARVWKMPLKAHLENGARAFDLKATDVKGIVKATRPLQEDLAALKKAGVIKADVGKIDYDFGPQTLAAYNEAEAAVKKANPNLRTRAEINMAIHLLATKKPPQA